MELKENLLLEYKNGRKIRVVYNERLSSIIYAIDMDKSRWPFIVKQYELETDYQNKDLTILSDNSYVRNVVEEELSSAELKRRNRAWEVVHYIQGKVDSEILIFESKHRAKAIKLAVESFNINYTSVKNYLIRYWKGGKVRNGLLPSFHMCGSKDKERTSMGTKRGRPRKTGANLGVNIDDKIKKFFRTGLNRYYYNGRQNTLRVTYELILKDFFTEIKIDSNGEEVPVIQDTTKIPTYHQFLYWYRKFNDPKKEIIKRKGARNYYQNHRSIGDSTQDAGLGPGTLWQIDSTQFDIYLVSSVNRNLIVGRPTVQCIVDVYSRMICGVNISFEAFNSYTSVMAALANSMLPKEDFCLQYGIQLHKGEWDVNCIPQRVFADRGELNGKLIEDAIGGLGISIQNAPPYRADYKGIIEQAFAQLNVKVKPFTDGIVSSGTRERGEEDYRLKANLTLDEFTKIVIKCVLFHNNHHVLSEYEPDETMISEGVRKIPKEIWNHGVKNMKGQLRVLPEQTVKMHLLPTDQASITSRGVRFKKMLYASDYSLKNYWYQLARVEGSKKIKIWYDPRDLSYIYTINEDGEFHQLTLLDHLSKYKRKGIDEINQIIKHEGLQVEKSKEQELQEKIKLYDEIQSIVQTGKQQTAAEKDSTLSKTSRLKGIRENQREERELQRDLLRNKAKENISVEMQSSQVQKQEDDLDLFRTLQALDWDENDE
ncbi:Mu transposase C-terminal domain-containing protein [Bacillus sp. JRC01]|nr:Mu transposase C-terminal domain-containing protein [Bacillus sp. JRC01]